MKVVNEAQERKLQIIWNGLKEIRALQPPDYKDKELYDLIDAYAGEQEGELPRRLKQFESNIPVIVALGMLKAGKSTLINLLARTRCASPMGYGVDTTLRPALVKMAKPGEYGGKGQILIYYSNGGNENKALGDLMDHLRGIERSQKNFSFNKIALTEKNLTNVLCREAGVGRGNLLEQEPLLVVVEVPFNEKCKILADGRMLLDMPGLDSANAAVSLAPVAKETHGDESNIANLITRYEAIIRECDLMLFVQSSVAPLNEKACDMLHRILAIRDSASAYIVQNIMQARYWRTETSQNEDQETQERHSQKVFREKFLQKSKGFAQGLRASSVNLGMAYDGLFPENPEFSPIDTARELTDDSPISQASLLAHSEFPKLEDNIFNILAVDSISTRFSYCLKVLKDEIDMAAKALNDQITSHEQKLKEAKQSFKHWDTALSNLKTLEQNAGKSIEKPWSVVLHNPINFEKCKNTALSKVPAMRSPKITIQVANQYLDVFKEECYQACRTFISNAKLSTIRVTCNVGEIPGVRYCNDRIKEILEDSGKLPVYKREDLQQEHSRYLLERPSREVKGEMTYLSFQAEAPWREPAVENITPLYDNWKEKHSGWAWLGKLVFEETLYDNFSDKIDPTGTWAKEKEYKAAFTKMIETFFDAHIQEAFSNIVNKAVREGVSKYKEELETERRGREATCNDLKAGLESRNAILTKLNEFKWIVEVMRPRP